MRFSSGSLAFTVLGWTPGLRDLIAGHVLPCGCLVGVYEVWIGECVEILDGRRNDCECQSRREPCGPQAPARRRHGYALCSRHERNRSCEPRSPGVMQ